MVTNFSKTFFDFEKWTGISCPFSEIEIFFQKKN